MPQATRKKPLPNAGILDIAPYVGGKPHGKVSPDLVKLSSNETPLGPSPRAINAYIEAAGSLHRYPDGNASGLRQAIAGVYGMAPERIVCGNGSDELIGMLIHAYARPGDNIVMSRHGFLMYKIYAQGCGVDAILAPEKNLRTDVDAMLAAVNEKTKLVFVANPNNPTGSYITAAELARLHKGLPPHVLLVVDAAYAEYAEAKDYSSGRELADNTENTVMLRTFSKIYGLAALRLGWAYAPAHVVDVLNRVRGPFNASLVAQATGIAAVQDIEYTREACRFNTEWLAWLSKEVAALGLTVFPSIGNFILVQFPAGKHNAVAANDFFISRGLVMREMAGYGLPDCLRISIGLEKDNRAVVKVLAEFLKT